MLAKAKLARFYGWTNDEIEALKQSDFVLFLKAIDPISAEENISQIRVSSYPHMKKDAQARELKSLKERARAHQEVKPASYADVAKALAQGMRRNGK